MKEYLAFKQVIAGWVNSLDAGTGELASYSSKFIEQNGPIFFSLLLAFILFVVVAYRNA